MEIFSLQPPMDRLRKQERRGQATDSAIKVANAITHQP